MPSAAPASEPRPPSPPLPPKPKAWQFSLRTLMIGMTGFAIFFALVPSLPRAVSLILVGTVWVVTTGWIVTGLFFSKGDHRAFCIGAAVVFSSMWSSVGGRLMLGIHEIAFFPLGISLGSSILAWSDLIVLFAMSVANGYLCIRARRYFERHK